MITYQQYKQIVQNRLFKRSLNLDYNVILVFVDDPRAFLSSTTDYHLIAEFCEFYAEFDLTEELILILPDHTWIERYRQFEADYYGHPLEYVGLPNAPFMN